MKLALLICLSADSRSGKVLSPELRPLDECKQALKDLAVGGVTPLPGYPTVEVWTAAGGRIKSKRLADVATQAKGKGKAKTNAAKGPSPEEIEAAKKAAEEAAAAEAAKKAAEEAAAAEAAKKAAEEAAKGTTPPISGEGNQPPPDE